MKDDEVRSGQGAMSDVHWVRIGPKLGTYVLCDEGLDGIRMVYDESACGLNKVLCAPYFGLPIVPSRALTGPAELLS